mmetsp:Transcript_20508/g.38248  ORF Transcript_20508/g.38248 Transcript_20508/m.38248 type:complete len:266 (+) Transcript_20508:1601-2398(+)
MNGRTSLGFFHSNSFAPLSVGIGIGSVASSSPSTVRGCVALMKIGSGCEICMLGLCVPRLTNVASFSCSEAMLGDLERFRGDRDLRGDLRGDFRGDLLGDLLRDLIEVSTVWASKLTPGDLAEATTADRLTVTTLYSFSCSSMALTCPYGPTSKLTPGLGFALSLALRDAISLSFSSRALRVVRISSSAARALISAARATVLTSSLAVSPIFLALISTLPMTSFVFFTVEPNATFPVFFFFFLAVSSELGLTTLPLLLLGLDLPR